MSADKVESSSEFGGVSIAARGSEALPGPCDKGQFWLSFPYLIHALLFHFEPEALADLNNKIRYI